jgi:hypothetical protein
MKPPPTLTDAEMAMWRDEAAASPPHARCRMTNGTLGRLIRRVDVSEGVTATSDPSGIQAEEQSHG